MGSSVEIQMLMFPDWTAWFTPLAHSAKFAKLDTLALTSSPRNLIPTKLSVPLCWSLNAFGPITPINLVWSKNAMLAMEASQVRTTPSALTSQLKPRSRTVQLAKESQSQSLHQVQKFQPTLVIFTGFTAPSVMRGTQL
jgi:hypothetical protein